MAIDTSKLQVKNITTEQRLLLDKLIEKFGDRSHLVTYVELNKAHEEITGKKYAPSWISRHEKVHQKSKWGVYDLTYLLKLPVVAFKQDVKKARMKRKSNTTGQPVSIENALKSIENIF